MVSAGRKRKLKKKAEWYLIEGYFSKMIVSRPFIFSHSLQLRPFPFLVLATTFSHVKFGTHLDNAVTLRKIANQTNSEQPKSKIILNTTLL